MEKTGEEKGLKNPGEQPNNTNNSAIEVKSNQNQDGGVIVDNGNVPSAPVSNAPTASAASTSRTNSVGAQNPIQSTKVVVELRVSNNNAPMREEPINTENVTQSENGQNEENLPLDENDEDDQMEADEDNEMVNNPELFGQPINEAPQIIFEFDEMNDELIFENDEVLSGTEDPPMEED